MRTNPIIRVLSAVLLLAGGAAVAGSFTHEQVAGDAVWVAHFDLERLRTSQVGDRLLKFSQEEPAVKNGLNEARLELGYDLIKDVDSVTFYGAPVPGSPGMNVEPELVVVCRGTFDVMKIGEMLRQRPGFKSEMYGRYELLKADNHAKGNPGTAEAKLEVRLEAGVAPPPVAAPKTDAPEQPAPQILQWACLVGPKLILYSCSQTPATLQCALDVLDGKRDSLAGSQSFPHLAQIEKAPLFMAAASLAAMPDFKPEAAVFQGTRAIALALREVQPPGVADPAAALLELLVIVDAKNEEDAVQIKQIVDGITAMIKLNMMQPPPDALVKDLLDRLKCNVQAREVTLTLAFPVQNLPDKLEKLNALGVLRLSAKEKRPAAPDTAKPPAPPAPKR